MGLELTCCICDEKTSKRVPLCEKLECAMKLNEIILKLFGCEYLGGEVQHFGGEPDGH